MAFSTSAWRSSLRSSSRIRSRAASAESRLIDAPDEAHLAFALRESRVVVTQDGDFLRLHARDDEHAGIDFAAQGSRSIGEMVRFLVLLHDCLKDDEMRGKVEYA